MTKVTATRHVAQKSSDVIDFSFDDVESQAEKIYKEHLFQTFQALKFVRGLPPAPTAQLRAKRVTLAKRPGYHNRKTIIFDLDETLVHCCDDIWSSKPDVVLPVTFPTG